MKIAKINGNTIESFGEHTELFPDTSFPNGTPSNDFLAEHGCVCSFNWKEHNNRTQKLVTASPYIENNMVFTVIVSEKTQDELEKDTEQQAKQLRIERNLMLANCDWTQISDATVDKAVWATYRQALRDVTTQTGFPWTITWPDAPQ
jgi:hypothetical protein